MNNIVNLASNIDDNDDEASNIERFSSSDHEDMVPHEVYYDTEHGDHLSSLTSSNEEDSLHNSISKPSDYVNNVHNDA